MNREHKGTCNSCGYDISSTLSDDICPECGNMIAEKLGTVWQRRPNLSNWMIDLHQFVVAPKTFWRRALLADSAVSRARNQIIISASIAGCGLSASLLLVILDDLGRSGAAPSHLRTMSDSFPAIFGLIIVLCVPAGVLLVNLHVVVLVMISAVFRFALSSKMATVICAHAMNTFVITSFLLCAIVIVGSLGRMMLIWSSSVSEMWIIFLVSFALMAYWSHICLGVYSATTPPSGRRA